MPWRAKAMHNLCCWQCTPTAAILDDVMPRPLPSAWLDAIVQYCDSVADGVTATDIAVAFQPRRADRTIRYWLSVLVTQGRLAKFGATRASRYWSPWRIPPRIEGTVRVHRTVHTVADPSASFPPDGPPRRQPRKVKRPTPSASRPAAIGSAGLWPAPNQRVAESPALGRVSATPPAVPPPPCVQAVRAAVVQSPAPAPPAVDTSAFQAKFAELIPLMVQSGVRPIAARHFISEAAIGEPDPRAFTAAFNAELNGLTESSARAYGISPSEFRAWKAGWR